MSITSENRNQFGLHRVMMLG